MVSCEKAGLIASMDAIGASAVDDSDDLITIATRKTEAEDDQVFMASVSNKC